MAQTPNLGMELQAPGENPGTWGDVVNDNLVILDTAHGDQDVDIAGNAADLAAHEAVYKTHLDRDHGPGIVQGLVVSPDAPASQEVVVGIGSAITPNGDFLEVAAPTNVDLSSFCGICEVLVYVVAESGSVILKGQDTTPTADQVELARVYLSIGATEIATPADIKVPGLDDIDSRFRPVAGTAMNYLKPFASSPVDDYVNVRPGVYQTVTGTQFASFPGGSKQINPISGVDPRFDLLYIDDLGVLQVTEGTEAVPPLVPEFPTAGTMVAVIYVEEAVTADVSDTDIQDVRPSIASDQSTRTIQGQPVDTADPSVTGTVLQWDGSKWAVLPPYGVTPLSGLKLKREISGDASMRTVTVAEDGGDFTTIAAALAYVDALTVTVDNQFTILVFPKRDGETWTISSAITIPAYVHFIGMGKPTLTVTVSSAVDVISLEEGTSFERFHIEIINTGFLKVIAMNGDNGRVIDVDFTTSNGGSFGSASYCLYGGYVNNLVVENISISVPEISDSLRGLWFADINDGFIRGFRFEGGVYGIRVEGSRTLVSDVVLEGLTNLLNANGPGTQISRCIVRCTETTPGANTPISTGTNVSIDGLKFTAAAGPDNEIILSPDSQLTNFDIVDCYVRPSARTHICNGRIHQTSTDTSLACVLVGGSGVIISNCHFTRNSVNAPCIRPRPTFTDVEVMIVGCNCDDTGTSPSIENDEATSTNWLLGTNIVDVATPAGNGWQNANEMVV